MTCDEVRSLLNARVDDELGPAQRAALDSHVKTCSSCAGNLAELEDVRNAIRGELHYHRATAELRNNVRLALRGAEYLDGGARQTGWKTWGAVAAAVAFCALATAPFLVNARNRRQLLAEDLVTAHQRALVGRSMDVISTDQHTVKPWFNGRIPFSPPVTDLAAEGFPLEGGRVDYAAGRPVAALVYGRRLHRIDVFVWPEAGEKSPPDRFVRDGFNEISWQKDNFVFTAVSDLNAAELKTFVDLLRVR